MASPSSFLRRGVVSSPAVRCRNFIFCSHTSLSSVPAIHPKQQHQQETIRCLSSKLVRVIVTDEEGIPNGLQKGVVDVKAGYARNFLIPQKKAVYATRQNFLRFGMPDPAYEATKTTAQQQQEQQKNLEFLADDQAAAYFKQAEILKHYLRNKTLKIWRNVNASTGEMTPGWVDALAVKRKLSKQLKIDLDHSFERIHLVPIPLQQLEQQQQRKPSPTSSTSSLTTSEVRHDDETLPQQLFAEHLPTMTTTDPRDLPRCQVQIRQVGDFFARIALRGGYSVPLRVEIRPR